MTRSPRFATACALLASSVGLAAASVARADPLPPQTSASRSLMAGQGLAADGGGDGDPKVAPDPFTGELAHEIPLPLPPGRGAVVPKLALAYRSGAGNGWVGVGWDLELGAVERETRRGVDFSADDYVLRMGGASRLQNVGGTEYRARIEDAFLRIRKLGSGSATYWEATTRSGVRYVFGSTAAARQADPADAGRVFRWCLDRVEDPSGNYSTVTYSKDRGAIYPELVAYTGNGLATPSNTVRFRRDGGVRPDAAVSYRTGFAVQTVDRLRSIEVRAKDAMDRVYGLEYDVGASTSRSLLWKLRRFGADAAIGTDGVPTGSELPATTFSYSTGAPASNTSAPGPAVRAGVSSPGIVNFDLSRVLYGDFNGDGRADIAYVDGFAASAPIRIFLSSGGEVSGPSRSVGASASAAFNDIARVKLGDFNGDGRTDILTIEGTTAPLPLRIYLADANGGFPQEPSFLGPAVLIGTPDVDVSRVMLADFDGDGKTDVLYSAATTVAVPLALFLSNGSGFDSAISGPALSVSGGVSSLARIKLGDFNGDGRTEIALVGPAGTTAPIAIHGLTASGTVARLMDGPDRTIRFDAAGARIDASRVMVADVNGDGLSDFLALEGLGQAAPMSLYLSKGTGFEGRRDGPSRTVDLTFPDQSINRVRLGDFNGDGRTDLAFVEGAGDPTAIAIHLSLGDRFGAALAGPIRTSVGGSTLQYELNRVGVGDFDGDGRDDFAGNDSSGGTSPMSLYAAQGKYPDLLTGIDNGIGGTKAIAYLSSAWYANEQLPSPVQTVSSVTVSDGNGVAATTSYAYSGGYHHFGDREFRGFNRADVTEPAGPDGEQAQTRYWFHQGNDVAVDQNHPSDPVGYTQGKPYRVEEWDLGAETFRETLTTYWEAPSAPHFAPVREVVARSCEAPAGSAPTCARTARKTYADFDAAGREVSSYDAYGNAKRENDYGDLADSNDDRTIVTTFEPNTAGWIVDRPATEAVYAGAGSTTALTLANQLAGTWFYYDGTLEPVTCASAGASPIPTRGLATRVERLLKGGVNPEEWAGYDGYGNVVCRSDADRRVSSFTYDGSATFQVQTRNAKNHLTVTEYYGVDGVPADTGRYGQPKKVTDPNLAETSFEYDVFGRNTREAKPAVVRPLAGDPYPGYTTTTSYFLGGVGTNRVESLTSAGEWSAQYLDGFGRIYRAKKQGSSLPGARVIATSTVFNATGTKRSTSLPYEDVANAAVRSTTFHYDAFGRVTNVTRPDATQTVSCYRDADGSSVTVDANGHRRRQVLDARGNLVRVQEYLGAYASCTPDAGDPYATTVYAYDRFSRLTTATDADGNQSVTDYDTLGRKSFQSDPDLGTWYYGYYPSGDLHWQQDANGTFAPTPYRLYFEYDALHRLTLKDFPTGTDESYVYDDPTVPYSLGRLTATTGAGGTTSYGYDAVGRSSTTVRTVDSVPYATGTGYDDAGRVRRETYPDASQATYEYDADGLLWKVSVAGVAQATLTGYNALGQVGNVLFGNGVTTALTYNDAGNNRVHSIASSNASGTVLSLTYDYDDVRNVTTIADGVDSARTQVFTYDELDRLRSATSAAFATLPYSDPAFAQAMNGAGVVYTYDPLRVHAVATTSDGRTYSYDNNGNLKTDGRRAMTYDYQNRPATVTAGAVEVDFAYDADGRRVTKRLLSSGVPVSRTVYVGRLYECTDGFCTRHVFAGDKRVASLRGDGTARYYHTDHLDSTRLVTDERGVIAESVLYRAFGDAPPGAAKYRFTSQELDAETGLYFYGARYYDALLGRFISPDPIAPRLDKPQTFNRYAYVLNNPLFYNDPSGNAEDPAQGISYTSAEDMADLGVTLQANCSGPGCLDDPAIGPGASPPPATVTAPAPEPENVCVERPKPDAWPLPLTYDKADSALDSLDLTGTTGELVLRSRWLEGARAMTASKGVLNAVPFVGLAGQTVVDAMAVHNYQLNGPGPNAISPNKALTNFGFGGASLALGGLPGIGLGVSYTLVDNLYPKGSHEGGFEAWKEDYTTSMNRTWRAQQMLIWPQTATQSERTLWRMGIRR